MSLLDDLKKQLRTRGYVQAEIDDDTVAAEWRTAARAAARELGRPVQTLRQGTVVAAALSDWPANELEREVQMTRMRNAVNAISLDPFA